MIWIKQGAELATHAEPGLIWVACAGAWGAGWRRWHGLIRHDLTLVMFSVARGV
ncbi:MAG TPA: hypothetical protein VGD52_20385 [Pseudoduganella sp.]